MPFEGGENEVIYCDSVCDANSVSLFWTLPHDAYDYQNKQSLILILSLLANESEGSLLSCLKSFNYASGVTADDVCSILTPFRLISFQLLLTEEGIQNIEKVLAVFFEYKRKLEEEWLADGKVLDYWQEEKTVSNLKYDVCSVRPAEEHALEVSQAMLWCDDVSQVIKRT